MTAGLPIICCHLVAIPWPGRGHINAMMNLCRQLASRSTASTPIRISFVVTDEWLGFLGAEPAPPPNVHLTSIPNVIPSEVGRASNYDGFVEAVLTKMEGPFERLLDGLEQVDGIIADTFLRWVVALGNRRGVPVHSLCPMAASFFYAMYKFHRTSVAANGHVAVKGEEDADEAGACLPGLNSLQLADFHFLAGSPLELSLRGIPMALKAQSILFTSFYELEAGVLDALRANIPIPVYSIGPSIPYMLLEKKQAKTNGSRTDYIGNWLDSQPGKSVLYVSLGSFLSVSGPQMDEIAMGLRSSGTRFLWVARSDTHRLQEMVGEMGLLVPWCDQLKALRHPSVGGFLTHCGWNSTLEAVYSGLPMLTFPIFWDQPIDSKLIVDEWKIGLNLNGGVDGRGGVVGREEIAEAVKKVMGSDGMRRRAEKLGEAARGAVEDGGSSFRNINCFIRDAMQLKHLQT